MLLPVGSSSMCGMVTRPCSKGGWKRVIWIRRPTSLSRDGTSHRTLTIGMLGSSRREDQPLGKPLQVYGSWLQLAGARRPSPDRGQTWTLLSLAGFNDNSLSSILDHCGSTVPAMDSVTAGPKSTALPSPKVTKTKTAAPSTSSTLSVASFGCGTCICKSFKIQV